MDEIQKICSDLGFSGAGSNGYPNVLIDGIRNFAEANVREGVYTSISVIVHRYLYIYGAGWRIWGRRFVSPSTSLEWSKHHERYVIRSVTQMNL